MALPAINGDAEPVEGTHAGNSLTVVDADDSDPEQNAQTVEDQPGFGVMETLVAVGGLGYLLKRRSSDTE